MANHTALPWEFEYDDKTKTGLTVFSGDETIVDFVLGKNLSESEANAAYIVKCCNAYPELIEALKATTRLVYSLLDEPEKSKVWKDASGLLSSLNETKDNETTV